MPDNLFRAGVLHMAGTFSQFASYAHILSRMNQSVQLFLPLLCTFEICKNVSNCPRNGKVATGLHTLDLFHNLGQCFDYPTLPEGSSGSCGEVR